MFPGPLGHSIIGRALDEGHWKLDALNLRDFGVGKHSQVDDTPYGGGAGMVMKPDVVGAAIEQAQRDMPTARTVMMSPRGTPLTAQKALELSGESLIVLCGRFEGVDQRVLDHYGVEEISIGDYVLAGGELPAMVMLEAIVRLIPGVLGEHDSIDEESFGFHENYAGLLEYPHYTKPPLWKGLEVPEVLRSGHHGEIERWRMAEAEEITKTRRPDLWAKRRIEGSE